MPRKKSPREQSKDITSGKSKPHHIGIKGNAVLQQEFFSLVNIKPDFRDNSWNKKFNSLCVEIEKRDPTLLASLKIKYQHLKPNTK